MKRTLTLLLITVLALVALTAPIGQALAGIPQTCDTMNGRAFDTTWYIENFSVSLNAGETIGGTGITTMDANTGDLSRDVYVQIDGVDYTQGFIPFNWSYTAPSTATYNILVQVALGDGIYTGGTWTCGVSGEESPVVSQPAEIRDGRLNSFDLAAPVAIYHIGDFIDIYAVNPNNSEGQRVIHFDLGDLPATDGELHTLATANNPFTGAAIELYLLSNGHLQVNTVAGDEKPYVYNWENE